MKKIIAVAAISLLTSGAWAHDKAVNGHSVPSFPPIRECGI